VRWLGVPRTRIERLSNEETGVTADTALRLSKVFGASPELLLNLQIDYEIRIAKRQIGKDLAKIAPIGTKAAWHALSQARGFGRPSHPLTPHPPSPVPTPP
jgi:plasmid maintenance system antidote protein VapI